MADTPQKHNLQPKGEVPEAAESAATFTPQVDIVERADDLVLVADVPGAGPNDIEMSVEEGVLKLRARVAPVKHEGYQTIYSEYAVGDFVRSFTLGREIDRAGITAELRNGVLRVVFPKIKEAQIRKIQVKGE